MLKFTRPAARTMVRIKKRGCMGGRKPRVLGNKAQGGETRQSMKDLETKRN
jgi:hypothetical protein